MNVQIKAESKAEILYHCETVWPWISLRPPDVLALARANRHLDELESFDPAMYDVVMQMLARAKGLDWRAVRDSK